MTDQPSSHHLDVPGGRLAYDVRGSGPLLLVVGQPMTAGAFGALAEQLAEDRTVVTYDPRGLGRSTVADPASALTPDVQADDLAALVGALGGGPVDVFGTSGGAIAGLALVARHPGLVGTLVAHEPPVTELLDDAPHVRDAVDRVEDAYRSGGAPAGWGAFVSLVVHEGPVPEGGVPAAGWPPPGHPAPEGEHGENGEHGGEGQDAPPAPPEPAAEPGGDDELFFLRTLKPLTRYQPELDALGAGGARVVVAVGEASQQELAVRSARALAARLGAAPVPLPGDHAGFLADPAAFAARLEAALRP